MGGRRQAGTLAGRSAPTSGQQIVETVVWWDFLGGGDGIRMKKLIDDFNNDHKDKDRDPGDDPALGRALLYQGADFGGNRRGPLTS